MSKRIKGNTPSAFYEGDGETEYQQPRKVRKAPQQGQRGERHETGPIAELPPQKELEPGIESTDLVIGQIPLDRRDPESLQARVMRILNDPEDKNHERVFLLNGYGEHLTHEAAFLIRQLCYLGIDPLTAYLTVSYMAQDLATPQLGQKASIPVFDEESGQTFTKKVKMIVREMDDQKRPTGNIYIHPELVQAATGFFTRDLDRATRYRQAPLTLREEESVVFLAQVVALSELWKGFPTTRGRIIVSPIASTIDQAKETDAFEKEFKIHRDETARKLSIIARSFGPTSTLTAMSRRMDKGEEIPTEELKANFEDITDPNDWRVRLSVEQMVKQGKIATAVDAPYLDYPIGGLEHAVPDYQRSAIILLRSIHKQYQIIGEMNQMMHHELIEHQLTATQLLNLDQGHRLIAGIIASQFPSTTSFETRNGVPNQAYQPLVELIASELEYIGMMSDEEIIAKIEATPYFQTMAFPWHRMILRAHIYIHYVAPLHLADAEVSWEVLDTFFKYKFLQWEDAGIISKIIKSNQTDASVPYAIQEILYAYETPVHDDTLVTDKLIAKPEKLEFYREQIRRLELPREVREAEAAERAKQHMGGMTPQELQKALRAAKKKKK